MIVENLKRVLKARSITYAKLASLIGLSEPSVKRVLSRGTLSLARLEQMCEAVGITVADLTRSPDGGSAEPAEVLTLDQETALAADPGVFACFYLAANGRSNREIETELGVDSRRLRRWIARLVDLGLVRSQSKLRIRVRTSAAIRWRPDGPMRRLYERQVRTEFLQSKFDGALEALQFRSAELSEPSCRVLQRKIERLAAEYRDLAELDASLPSAQKRSIGCLLAIRPWVFSMFDGLRGL